MFTIQKFDFLIGFYITCVIISEVMGVKTIPIISIGLLHVNTTVTIFILPIIYSINDIIVEVYGKSRAQSIVRTSTVMILFLLIFSLTATNLPPSTRFLSMNSAYNMIFSVSARFSFASLIAFVVSEFSDVFIFTKLRERFGKKRLWIRTNLSNFVSEFFDTALFMILAFYTFDQSFVSNMSFITGISLPFWILRCCMSVIETPLVYLGVRWLRKKK